ncbi:MAG: hypothetical protein LC637_12985 [Xanthomonadaceae bacterium]|nr:hypothetical protein [Xanthomonadaceae bacterium]
MNTTPRLKPALQSRVFWAVVMLIVCAGIAYWPSAAGGDAPARIDGAEYVGSEHCHGCHRGRFASWHRTFHRSMTREAGPDTVQGRFDGQAVTQWGITVRPVRQGDRYYFEYFDAPGGRLLQRQRVERTVGSNRYQQYLTGDSDGGGNYYRLHLLWHNQDQRWVHTNAAFLGPDEQHFDSHITVWNNNCIFCHNTGPEPNVTNYDEMLKRAGAGEPVDPRFDSEFDSSVAELGIACESCHGPASLHIERHANVLTRLWYTLTGKTDDSIVSPQDLERDAATQVCGQCHAQRLPKSVDIMRRFLDDGPVYRPGGDLFESVDLVWPESRLPVATPVETDFELRFWDDRTPRLTAYEYQGLLQSKCHSDGELTCMNCHSMHDGDPRGMLTDANRGERPCLECHQPIAADIELHTRHAPASAGSACQACHMPEVVYGVMEIHRSHRIEVPDPAADAAANRPNACTLCHVDRSLTWAEEQAAVLWERMPAKVTLHGGLDTALPDGVTRLFGGDPVERAVTAVAIGRTIERGQIDQPEQWRGILLAALDDDYPAVRRFAWRSLVQLEQTAGSDSELLAIVQQHDPLLRGRQREAALVGLHWQYRERLGPVTVQDALPAGIQTETLEALRQIGRSRSEAINIGE